MRKTNVIDAVQNISVRHVCGKLRRLHMETFLPVPGLVLGAAVPGGLAILLGTLIPLGLDVLMFSPVISYTHKA